MAGLAGKGHGGEDAPLEPIIAHGSRMSWAGILRPGDEFPTARRSQLAVLTAESGPSLARYFGRWSSAYRRFTTNLTSAKIVVKALEPGELPGKGIMCVLHWVDRADMIRVDKGGVCYGDGWPPELWRAFTSELDRLPTGTVAEKLRGFAESHIQEDNGLVGEWRERLKEGRVTPEGGERSLVGDRLLPTPARLITDDGTSECVVSWASQGTIHHSLSRALSSLEGIHRHPDRESQAKYYLECTLAKLHRVRFGPDDWLEDKLYEDTEEFLKLALPFRKLERQRIVELGSLDGFRAAPTPP